MIRRKLTLFASGGAGIALATWAVLAIVDRGTVTFSGELGRGHTVIVSSDGRRLAGWDVSENIRIWDSGGRTLARIPCPICSWNQKVSFSPDGSHVAVATGDNKTVSYWEVASGCRIRAFQGHPTGVSALSFHPDGKTLATAASDGTVILWDVATANKRNVLAGYPSCGAIAFSQDGMILVCKNDKDMELRELPTNRVKSVLRGHQTFPFRIEFSPDGKTLASMDVPAAGLKLWDVAAGKERYLESPDWWRDDVDPYIECIAFSPDSSTLATTSSYSVGVWDVKSGKSLARLCPGRTSTELSIPWPAGFHTVLDTSRELNAVAFAPDGCLYVYGKESNRLKRWTIGRVSEFAR
jgi:WD40 repeat protein